ncbi:UNVERIFIED_CONTAM: hypothetical protein GTU68_040591 [Idotea baltica]|nr:hypothetical protein [Idotea baltica]
MGFNLLALAEPICHLIPDVVKPQSKPNITIKTAYTAITLFIYLICCQIPLYGIERSYAPDPLYWTRVILASSRGTLMELGIGPIISASWIIQITSAMGLLKVLSTKDEKTIQGLEKTFGMIMCFGEALGQIWYGNYGPPSTLGAVRIGLILAQLMFAGFIVILLDDLLRGGYGLGSGISLFIVANISENIIWSLFSPVTHASEYGIQFEGSFVCLVHYLISKPSKWSAVYLAFTRSELPNLMSFVGTLLIFFIVIYLQGFKIRIPLIHQQHRGYRQEVPIKLFYTSNISVILQSMFVSNFYMLSRLLYARFNNTVVINLLGKWEDERIVGGLVWYISPPADWNDFILYPHRFLTYVIFICTACAFFSR